MGRHSSGAGWGYQRPKNIKPAKDVFLVVCEGEKTEPNYFKCFRKDHTNVDVELHGEGYNTLSLVTRALDIKAKGNYDQVWCVFDRDSFPSENFNDAVQLAESKGLKVAYSNEAFEIWYLLHFDLVEAALSRDLYKEKLTAQMGAPYRKNSETMYEYLKPMQCDAIRNARKLLETHGHTSPTHANPSTRVHELVCELNKHYEVGKCPDCP